jgi:hypothetical protein
MSALEQEIIEKFRLLDREAQQRVRLQIEQEESAESSMSPKGWLVWAQNFGNFIHDKYGSLQPNSVDLLNEAREERLDDLMGGR